jgi:hypothetical protein
MMFMSDQETVDKIISAPEGAIFLTTDHDRAIKFAAIYMRGDLKIAIPDFVLWRASDIRNIGLFIVLDAGVSLDDYSMGTEEEIATLNEFVDAPPPPEPLS